MKTRSGCNLEGKIDQFDFVMASDCPPKNPQGYLYASITDPNWQTPPAGYQTPQDRKREAAKKRKELDRKKQVEATEKERQKWIARFLGLDGPKGKEKGGKRGVVKGDSHSVGMVEGRRVAG